MTKTKPKAGTSENFKSLVEMTGRKPGEIAEAAGLSRSFVYDLMSGRKRTKPWTAKILAKALRVSFDRVWKALKVTSDNARRFK